MGNVGRAIQQMSGDGVAYALATVCMAGLLLFTGSVVYSAIQLDTAVGFYVVVFFGHLLGVLVLAGRTIQEL